MKPLMTYYGGKQTLAKKIISMIPEHEIYVEPFAGGAAVLFAKEPSAKEVLNDLDDEIGNVYRVAQGPLRDELIQMLEVTGFSEVDYKRACGILRSLGTTVLERAWAIIVVTQQGVRARSEAFGWRRAIHKSVNHPTYWQNKLRRLAEIFSRLEHVYITSDDVLKCIDRWDTSSTFFYCDPPYVYATQGYAEKYSQEQLEMLIAKLDGIKGKFVLSGCANASVPDSWHCETVNTLTSCAANSPRAKRVEHLWSKK